MDHRFRPVDRHVVRAIRTFRIGPRYRILLDPAGYKRAEPKGVSLLSRIFSTLPRYYYLLRQDFLHCSRNCFKKQRQGLQHRTYGNQP